MIETYIIYGENIYYLDNNNNILGLEFFTGTINPNLMKNSIVKPLLINNIFIENATLEEIIDSKVKNLKLQQYEELLPTDWYYTRFLETGQEVPLEIKQQRQQIREKYDQLINNILLNL